MPIPTPFASHFPNRADPRISPRPVAAASTAVLLVVAACGEPLPPPSEPESVRLRPQSVELTAAGETAQITALVIDQYGDTLTDYDVHWTVNDTMVATVSQTGLVRAVASGVATIRAAVESAAGAAAVTVDIDVERDALVALYEATGGPTWRNDDGWLSDDPVSDWHGVQADGSGVVALNLANNFVSGSLPPEIRDLAELRTLALGFNEISGSIPRELGDLENLERLYLNDNAFSGEIPAELENLSQLNDLWLGGNNLGGPFPVHLTRLPNLERLSLTGNPHTGTLPDEIGAMVGLRRLHLTNTGLSGVLPGSMTDLQDVAELMLGGTKLCVPDDDDFRTWLEGIPKRRVPACAPGGESAAYLTQASQSLEYPVSLVAGEKALLRVFVVAPAAKGDTIPLVRATFYLDGEVEEVVEIEPGSSLIGDEVNEGSLDASANVEVPASAIKPGLEMVVEIDPDTTMDSELGVAQRIPETGRMAVSVRQMPDLELTLIPFLLESDPDSAILDITKDLSPDDELLWQITTLLPVAEMDLKIHDAVLSSTNSAFSLLAQTGAIRVAEGGTGYWMGTMSGGVTGAAGVAYVPGWTSFSIPDSAVMAHELGHNLSLYHAPCGGAAGPDPSFPQPNGTIGAWGYDFESGELVDPSTRDLMSYCDPTWISEFYFTNSLRHRLDVEVEEYAARRAAPVRSLLIWGGTDPNGVPYLEPAFVIDAMPHLPRFGGSYRLRGVSGDGAELFALDFDMPVIADAEGRGSFAFTVPVQAGWADELRRITLSGPNGSFTLDADTDSPGAIVRDAHTGKVRGIFSDLPPGSTAAEVLAGRGFEPGLEVFFSRGIPDAAEWRR